MAYELDRYRRLTLAEPAQDFAVPEEQLLPFSLCRRPRSDHYADDVTAIAARSGVRPETVANILRATEVVSVLAARQRDTPASSGMLTAARDHAAEQTVFEEPAGVPTLLPGWLSSAVDRFWGDDGEPGTRPRELLLPILINLPVAIIEMEGLTVRSLGDWLQRRNLPAMDAVVDRPLRGCLVALGGLGVIFVDRTDADDERRLTLAHEVGHFLLDYLVPREDVARRRPELLDVLDGVRAPTDAERFDALLADIPVGFHTHVLERDAHGGHLSNSTAEVEDRAERFALELLAPLRSVLREAGPVDDRDVADLLRRRFGIPHGAATRYANHVRRLRPRPAGTFFDAIGLTPPSRFEDNADATDPDRPQP
ncbi:ImmA/IrrE family metallo-endopeptidase [Geodermatophilus sp. URMC 63]